MPLLQVGYTVRPTDRGFTHTPTFGYMRLSVPNIPPSILSNAALRNVPSVLPSEAVQRIASFLSSGTTALLTGAGVSVDSGVKAYRGKDGRYMNPDYKCAPLQSRFERHLRSRHPSSDQFSWAPSAALYFRASLTGCISVVPGAYRR